MQLKRLLESFMVLVFLTACSFIEANGIPSKTSTTIPTTVPTSTPDPCTGWVCTVAGIVYAESAQSGNELEGVSVTLNQSSYCSPTRGLYQDTTDTNGRFEFSDIFFHDTDLIRIQVEYDGYATSQWKSNNFYCYYCNCFKSPLEILLHATLNP